jgi:hypothetical protein
MNIWVEFLASLIRAAVQVVVGILVSKGVIDSAQSGHFTGELTLSIVGAVVLFLGTYGSSVWKIIKARVHFLDALGAAPGTPVAEVIKLSDNTSVATQISIATAPTGGKP